MRRLLTVLLSVAIVTGGAAAADAAPAKGGRTEYLLKSLYVDGRGGSHTTVVGNGGTVRLFPALSWRYWSGTLSAPRIELQWKRGGAWKDVPAASVTVPSDLQRKRIVVRTRPYSTSKATETIDYRLVSRAYSNADGLVTRTSRSHAFAVRYENQAAYTGLRAAAWDAVREYCPTTAVQVGGTDGDDVAGEFFTGASRIHVSPVIATYTAAQLRGVALHECAHELQWLDYGSTSAGEDRMTKAAAAIYTDDAAPDGSSDPSVQPFDAVEHAADCASHAIEPDGYLGYGGYCDADELAAGLRLMAGGRY